MQPKDPTINKNEHFDNCVRCNQPNLRPRAWKYCSPRCSKLHLKSLYRKRKSEELNQKNREHRRKAIGGYSISPNNRKDLFDIMPNCQKCNSRFNLQSCHIKPHWAGGTNDLYNFIVLCRVCHFNFDNQMRSFWNMPADQQAIVAAKNMADDLDDILY